VLTHLTIEGERHEAFGDAGGVAYTKHIEAFIGELLAEEIDGGIAGGYYEYLLVVFFYEGFYGLYQCGGFAGAGRAMDNGEFVGGDDFIYGFVLYAVEFRVIEEVYGGIEGGGFLAGEDVYQSAFLGFGEGIGIFEGALHFVVAVVIEKEVYAEFAFAGPVGQLIGAEGDFEYVATGVGNGAFQPVVFRVVIGEQHGGCAEAELVVDILMGCAFYFYIDIIALGHFGATDGYGVPGEAVFATLVNGCGFGELEIRFAVFDALHLEEVELVLEVVHFFKS